MTELFRAELYSIQSECSDLKTIQSAPNMFCMIPLNDVHVTFWFAYVFSSMTFQ